MCKNAGFKICCVYERLENTAIRHLSSESRKSDCMMLAKALYSFSYAMCVSLSFTVDFIHLTQFLARVQTYR